MLEDGNASLGRQRQHHERGDKKARIACRKSGSMLAHRSYA